MSKPVPINLSDVSDADLASATGVSREAVRLWKKGQRRVSVPHAHTIEAKFGISIRDLRPDLFRPAAVQPQPVAA